MTSESGETLLIETSGSTTGREDVGLRDSSYKLEEFEASLHNVAVGVRNALRHVAPDKLTVEFGVEFAAESGKLTALIVKGSATANLKVTLEWSKDEASGA